MKKIFPAILITLLIQTGFAQQELGQVAINAGVGYSPEFNGNLGTGPNGGPFPYFPVRTSIDQLNETGSFYCSSITPNLGAMVDFGLGKKISVGIASSYQSEIINWTLDGYPPYFSDKVTRVNVALRFLYRLPWTNKHWDPYTGFRLGSSYWHDIPSLNNSITNPPYIGPFINKTNLVVTSFQVLCGMHFYFTNNIGIQAEFGLGSPYLVEGGFTLRINTRKATLPPTSNSYGDMK